MTVLVNLMFRRLDKCDGSIFGETNIQDVNWVTYLRGHIFSERGGGIYAGGGGGGINGGVSTGF